MIRTTFFIELPIHYTIRTDTVIEDFCNAMTTCGVEKHANVEVFVRKVENAADQRVMAVSSHSKTRVDDAKNVFQSIGEYLDMFGGYFDLGLYGVFFPAVTHELCPKSAGRVYAEMIRVFRGGYSVVGRLESGRARLDWGRATSENIDNCKHFLLGEWG